MIPAILSIPQVMTAALALNPPDSSSAKSYFTPEQREAQILSHQRLVQWVASRLRPCFFDPKPDLQDLVQLGNLALIKAIDSFDPACGASVATWALHKIRSSILHYRIKHFPGSQQRFNNYTRLGSATLKVTHDLNCTPTSEDLAAHLGMTLAEFLSFQNQATPLIYETTATMPDTRGTPYAHVHVTPIPSPDPDPQALALTDELRQRLAHALKLLPPKYRQLVLLHIAFDMPLKQIVKHLHTDPRTVKESLARAMTLLRAQLGETAPVVTRILPIEPIAEVEQTQPFQLQQQHCLAFA